MTKESLLQQALDALILSQAYIGPDNSVVPGWVEQLGMNDIAIDALRVALARPEQPASEETK